MARWMMRDADGMVCPMVEIVLKDGGFHEITEADAIKAPPANRNVPSGNTMVIIGHSDTVAPDGLPFAPRTDKTIEQAIAEERSVSGLPKLDSGIETDDDAPDIQIIPGKPLPAWKLNAMNKAELAAHAQDTYGLTFSDPATTRLGMIKAIKEVAGNKS